MAKFTPYEESSAQQATSSPNENSPFRTKRINQATELSTDEWTEFNFSQVNRIIVRRMPVDAQMRINDRQGDPVELNPGDSFTGEINKIWLKNAETYPSSLSEEHLVLLLNPTIEQSQSLAPLMRD